MALTKILIGPNSQGIAEVQAGSGSGGRTSLTAATTFYFRTDGSNTNNGLTDSPSGAFLTPQFAYDKLCSSYDTDGFAVTIKAGNEGSQKSFVGPELTQPWTGGGSVTISGNSSATTIFTDSVNNFGGIFISATLPGNLFVQKIDFASNAVSLLGIFHSGAGLVYLGPDIVFEAQNNGGCVDADGAGARIILHHTADITIKSGATFSSFIGATAGAEIGDDGVVGSKITFSGTPAASRGMYNVTSGAAGAFNTGVTTYVGNYTGVIAQIDSSGVIRFGFGYTFPSASNQSFTTNNGIVQVGPSAGWATFGSNDPNGGGFSDVGNNWGIDINNGQSLLWPNGGYGWITSGSVNFSGLTNVSYPTTESSISRETANHVGFRNIASGTSGGSPTKFDFYNTNTATQKYNPPTNYERFTIDWQAVANTVILGTEELGTGVAREMRFQTGGVLAVRVDTSQQFFIVQHGAADSMNVGGACNSYNHAAFGGL